MAPVLHCVRNMLKVVSSVVSGLAAIFIRTTVEDSWQSMWLEEEKMVGMRGLSWNHGRSPGDMG